MEGEKLVFCWGEGGEGGGGGRGARVSTFLRVVFGEEEEVDWSWRVSGILTVIVCVLWCV